MADSNRVDEADGEEGSDADKGMNTFQTKSELSKHTAEAFNPASHYKLKDKMKKN